MGEHVRDDELMDTAEATASAAVRRHVQACASCRERVDKVAEGWELAGQAEVPEPSPLYWESFKHQLGRRVGAQRWWRSAAWAPVLAAAAVLVIAAGVFLPRTEPVRPVTTLPAWSAALPAAEEDAGLVQLGALVADEPDELAALGGCSGLARCLSGLSEEETMALADALSQELGPESDL